MKPLFTSGQLRGILWFIPAVVMLSLLIAYLGRPRLERSLEVAADQVVARPVFDTLSQRQDRYPNHSTRARGERYPAGDRTERPAPFAFDPNALDAAGFERLGFSPRQAEVILRYRASLGGFRDISQFADCYVVSREMFARLEPYITLVASPETSREPLPEPAARTAAVRFGPVELNGADSASLVTVSGIGALTAGRILALRSALGGFANKEQLAEVRGMTRENYERILGQIFVDSAGIRKIDINFASPQQLATHPYFMPEVLRKVVKNRQLKGGWSSTEQLIEDKTLTREQAERLAPYLIFNP